MVTCLYSSGLLIYLQQNSTPVLSSSQIQSCKRYSDCTKIVAELDLHSRRINEALRLLDPLAYASHADLSTQLQRMYPFVRSRSAIDPLLFSRAFNYLQSGNTLSR